MSVESNSASGQSLRSIVGGLIANASAFTSPLWVAEARMRGISVEPGVRFFGRPMLHRSRGAEIVIRRGAMIRSALRSNILGCFQPSAIQTVARGARIELGERVGISATAICAATSITIGEGTIIGAGAMIVDTNFHEPQGEWGWNSDCMKSARPVRIGRGVFIGARAIILKGVTIGDRAVIGAGAVVAKDVPAGATAVGNPARVVKSARAFPDT